MFSIRFRSVGSIKTMQTKLHLKNSWFKNSFCPFTHHNFIFNQIKKHFRHVDPDVFRFRETFQTKLHLKNCRFNCKSAVNVDLETVSVSFWIFLSLSVYLLSDLSLRFFSFYESFEYKDLLLSLVQTSHDPQQHSWVKKACYRMFPSAVTVDSWYVFHIKTNIVS